MNFKMYLKHSMSCLKDLGMEVLVDQERRQVMLTMRSFDSSLVAEAVIGILPERHGIVAFRDDGAKSESWLTPIAPFDLVIQLAGVSYSGQVVRLIDGRIAVTLSLSPP